MLETWQGHMDGVGTEIKVDFPQSIASYFSWTFLTT